MTSPVLEGRASDTGAKVIVVNVNVDVSDAAQVQAMVARSVEEFGEHNVRVNSVAPGAIDTPMLRGALQELGLDEESYAPQLSLLNRFGQPREIAEATLWLASDTSSYLTGTTIHADAGYVGRQALRDSRIRPSRISITRSKAASSERSWVTMTVAAPVSRVIPASRSTISRASARRSKSFLGTFAGRATRRGSPAIS